MRIANILTRRLSSPSFGYQCRPYEDYAQTAEEHVIALGWWTVVIWTHNYCKD